MVHRALIIPEILAQIFQSLFVGDNAASARVCKAWKECALDALWHEVRLSPIFLTLCPDMANIAGRYRFTKQPSVNDWSRFLEHSRRVRILADPSVYSSPRLHLDAVNEIAASRTTLKIFPIVRSIHWTLDFEGMNPVWMNDTVEELFIHVHEMCPPTTDQFHSFVDHVLERMPFVRKFELEQMGPLDKLEADFLRLWAGLTMLREIALPLYILTPRVLSVLAGMKHLRTIEINYTLANNGSTGDEFEVRNFKAPLEDGAFPSLRALSFSTRLKRASQFLTQENFPLSNLTSLCIRAVPIASGSEDLKSFLEILSTSCVSMDKLQVVLNEDDGDGQPNVVPSNSMIIRIGDIRPVLSFRCLTKFILRNTLPAELDDSEIETLAKDWPHLEELDLVSEPYPERPSTLSLYSLLHFARHCPRIRHLGLYLDIFKTPRISPSAFAAASPFRNLECLNVGFSRSDTKENDGPGGVGDVHTHLARVAECLSYVLAESKVLVWGDPQDWKVFTRNYGGQGMGRWKEVREMLRLILSERYRLDIIAKENQKDRYRAVS